MKRWLCMGMLAVLLLSALPSEAEIRAPLGQGQIGWMAYVLCENLTVREQPAQNARTVQKLRYGTKFMVTQRMNGYCDVILSDAVDAEAAGWVLEDYVLIDPPVYVTETGTPVYAWPEARAKRVGYLATGTELPVISMEKDWVLVSLRGAVAWIRKTELDREYDPYGYADAY